MAEPFDPSSGNRRRLLLLAVLVLVGLGLRLSVIGWGIGLREFEGYYHPDESKVWRSAIDFPSNYLANENYLYGTALPYSVGLALYPVKRLWRSGRLHTGDLEYRQVVILALRAVNAVLGALTLLLVYRLGRRLWDRGTGLIAAALLCFSLYHVMNAGFATLDVTMSFLVTLVVLLAARAFATGRLVDFVWLGLAGGFLAGTKVSGALILVVPLVLLAASIVGPSRRGMAEAGAAPDAGIAPGSRELGLGLLVSGLVAMLVFAVSTPHVVLRTPAYLDFMLEQRRMWVERVDHGLGAILSAWSSAAATAMTPVIAVLAGAGLLLGRIGVRGGERALEYALVAYVLANVLFWRAYFGPRFLIPLVPILCLYAARPPRLLLSQPGRVLRAAGAAVAFAAVAFSVYAAVAGAGYRREADTRTAAGAFIAGQVPQGATLAPASTTARNPWTRHRWRYPAIDTARHTITPLLENPDYVVTTSYALGQMERALESGHLDADYNWPPEMAGRWYRYLTPEPEDFRFFDSLLEEESYRLVKRWNNPPPVPVEFPAPEIRLYRRTR